jgi:hypothetical protein
LKKGPARTAYLRLYMRRRRALEKAARNKDALTAARLRIAKLEMQLAAARRKG